MGGGVHNSTGPPKQIVQRRFFVFAFVCCFVAVTTEVSLWDTYTTHVSPFPNRRAGATVVVTVASSPNDAYDRCHFFCGCNPSDRG